MTNGDDRVTARSPLRKRRSVLLLAGLSLAMFVAHRLWPEVWMANPVPEPETFVVATQPFSLKVSFAGMIVPGAYESVAAPFDGIIQHRSAAYGAEVTAGAELLRLSTDELESRLREAELAYIKANAASTQLADWTNSAEVVRARRTVEQHKSALAALDRQLAEGRDLLQRGIVSRNEVQAVEQQREAQIATLKTSEEDLDSVRARDNAESRRLADLEVVGTKVRLEDLRTQLAGAVVRASTDGILLRAAENVTSQPNSIEAGSRVSRGQPLFRIAEAGRFAVQGRIAERDVMRVRPGMAAEITIEALPGDAWPGNISSIGVEASADSGGRFPGFGVLASMNKTGSQRTLPRLGMSARVSVEVYRNDAAIVVPIEAVRSWRTRPYVLVRRNRIESRVDVTLGSTTVDSVEIKSGLSVGDELVLPRDNETNG